MRDEKRPLYELAYPTPSFTPPSSGPTLVVALHGFADAGQAIELATDHLLGALEYTELAVFNVDELVDYRDRRPAVTIYDAEVVDMSELSLAVYLMKDANDKPFLLLAGPEPDFRWKAFSQAVKDIVERFGIAQTVSLYSAPRSVPHTRPMPLSAHSNRPHLVERYYSIDATVVVPGSAALRIESDLAADNHAVAGYTAHVPNYIAANKYPEAALKLLNAVQLAGGLSLPLGALEKDAREFFAQVEDKVGTFPEIQQVLETLETNYDEEQDRFRREYPGEIAPGEGGVPTGEELGAELEAFLASHAGGDHKSHGSRPGNRHYAAGYHPREIDNEIDNEPQTPDGTRDEVDDDEGIEPDAFDDAPGFDDDNDPPPPRPDDE